jgi:NET1-associated nuclear protein 1 (U3 small nucleolar RNA-associated protein 17)
MAGFIGNFLFFTQGNTLYSLDVKSNKLTHHKAHNDSITGFQIVSSTVYTSSSDGKICVWTLPSPVLIDCSAPVRMMAVTPTHIYFIRGSVVHINSIDLASYAISPQMLFKNEVGDCINLSTTADYLNLVVLHTRCVKVLNIASGEKREYTHTLPLTSLTVHPQDAYITVGDASGQILKFYPDGVKSKEHWHAHAISALKFTADGTFLLSGGEEGVLVLWHQSTHRRTFMPRIGAKILNVAVAEDGSLYGVVLNDNSVKVYDSSSYKEVASYLGITNPSKIIPGTGILTGLVKYGDELVFNAGPGFLQFYNATKGKVTRRLDCVRRNPVSRVQIDYPNPLQVSQVSVLPEMNAIATLETSNTPHFKLSNMKFWENSKVVTRVINPHFNSVIKIAAGNGIVVSIGKDDKQFSIWVRNSEVKENKSRWEAKYTGSYRQLEPSDVAIHRDTIYILFGNALTIWDFEGNLKQESFETAGEKLLKLRVSDEFLVTSTLAQLQVWRNLKISWRISLEYIHDIIIEGSIFLIGLNASKFSDPETRCKKTNILLKFESSNPKPTKIYKVDSPLAFTIINQETFILTKQAEMINLDSPSVAFYDDLPVIPAPEKPSYQPKPLRASSLKFTAPREIENLSKIESHKLPSLTDLFERFMKKELSAS